MPSVALVCVDGGHRGRLLDLGAPPGAFDIDVTDDGGMMVRMALVSLEDAGAFLREFAMRQGIRRLALFGSVLRGEDTPDSDVDLLVEFEEGRTPGLLRMAELELEL